MTTKGASGSEFRFDQLRQRWILSAPVRSLRPGTTLNRESRNSPEACPFCPGNEKHTPREILAVRPASTQPNEPGWQVRVVPNKYPAVVEDASQTARDTRRRSGYGTHEVIVETPDHNAVFFEQPIESLTTTLRVFAQRLRALRSDPLLRYAVIFKNSGDAAGASLKHPHSQLVALPDPPTDTCVKVETMQKYHAQSGSCLLCDLAAEEANDGTRLLELSEYHVAFCPYASRLPFEVCILPHAHTPAFDTGSDRELEDVARLLRRVVAKLASISGGVAYNLVLQTAPWGADGTVESSFHWHLELLPRLTGLAGFELGAGVFINPVTSEEAAQRLRDAK